MGGAGSYNLIVEAAAPTSWTSGTLRRATGALFCGVSERVRWIKPGWLGVRFNASEKVAHFARPDRVYVAPEWRTEETEYNKSEFLSVPSSRIARWAFMPRGVTVIAPLEALNEMV
jgi:hypothetical protein